MSDFQSSISTISEADLEKLLGDSSIITIDESNVALATEGKDGTNTAPEDKKNPVIPQNKNAEDIPFVDIDKLEEDGEEEKKDEGKKEEPKKEEKVDKKAEAAKAAEAKAAADKAAADALPAVTEVLRNTAAYLIEKGLWQDFDGREEYLKDLTEESYAELAQKQIEYTVQQKVTEEIDSTGDYGKAIIEYAKNGGNPDEVIDLFKEQKSIEAIAIDSEDGQKELIQKFYTEVYDWTKDKAKKYINGLITSDELESEAKEVQEKYQQYHKEQLETLKAQQAQAIKQTQEEQKRFVQTINSKLTERKDFTDTDRKLIQDSVFKYDKSLPDGTKVNRFYLKFAEMQRNPDDYLDLVKFVMDKKGYNEKVKSLKQTEDTEKKWNFVKGNAAVNTSTAGSKHETPPATAKKIVDLDFSGLLNKK